MGFENTPFMTDGVLYDATTPYGNAASIDAETGKELWRHDAQAFRLGPIPASGYKHRGGAFWGDGKGFNVFVNTRNRLFSLDVKHGKPVDTFGDNGSVSLTDEYPQPIDPRHVNQGSPPIVYKDLVIVGSSISDRYQHKGETPGLVQAYNARTGRRAWAWNVIPQSPKDFGADTLGKRVVENDGACECMEPDDARRGAGAALRGDLDARQRLLRRPAEGKERAGRIDRLSRCQHRSAQVVISIHPPWPLGL